MRLVGIALVLPLAIFTGEVTEGIRLLVVLLLFGWKVFGRRGGRGLHR